MRREVRDSKRDPPEVLMQFRLIFLIVPVLWIVGCADGTSTDPLASNDGSTPTIASAANDADSDTDADTDGDTDTDADTDGDSDTDTDGVSEVECEFTVPLRANQEVPPSASRANGVARIEIEGTELEYEVGIANPGRESFTAGHIHQAPRGANGPVVRGLYPNNPALNEEFEARGFPNGSHLRLEAEGTIPLALAQQICAQPELFYLNFHTLQSPPGAIRGQLR